VFGLSLILALREFWRFAQTAADFDQLKSSGSSCSGLGAWTALALNFPDKTVTLRQTAVQPVFPAAFLGVSIREKWQKAYIFPKDADSTLIEAGS